MQKVNLDMVSAFFFCTFLIGCLLDQDLLSLDLVSALFFAILLAGSTSAVAYLLDPAIKQLFIEQKQSYIYIIPGLIVLAFSIKGLSLYLARVIMINVSENVRKE